MELYLKIAESRYDILQCHYLIAEVYNAVYDIVFSEDPANADPHSKIEPYPDLFLMALANEMLVAAVGLYTHTTYVERYGNVNPKDIAALLDSVKTKINYSPTHLREFSKMVVRPNWQGNGISLFLAGACHSAYFINRNAELPPLIVCCETRRLFQHFHKANGIRTRFIKSFPYYRVHEQYRSADNPMESHLIIPELDIPKKWHTLELPGWYRIGQDVVEKKNGVIQTNR